MVVQCSGQLIWVFKSSLLITPSALSAFHAARGFQRVSQATGKFLPVEIKLVKQLHEN